MGFSEVPEFLLKRQPELTPDDLETGERIWTPRGSFYVTAMSREQMETAGYGVHHISGRLIAVINRFELAVGGDVLHLQGQLVNLRPGIPKIRFKPSNEGKQQPPTKWNSSTITKILSLQEYCGDILNFKTYSKSYKNKKVEQENKA